MHLLTLTLALALAATGGATCGPAGCPVQTRPRVITIAPQTRPQPQVQPQAQPQPLAWHDANFGGITIRLYGWKDAAGIHWTVRDNPAVTPELIARLRPTPKPGPSTSTSSTRPTLTATAGVTMDRDGSLNAGVTMPAMEAHGGQIDTNDPKAAEILFGQGDATQGPSTSLPDLDTRADSAPDREQASLLVPGSILAAAVVIGVLGLVRRQP